MPAEPGFRYRPSLTAEARHGTQRVVSTRTHPRRKLLVTVLVILLLVPAGLLALRSLWTSVRTAGETTASPTPAASGPPTASRSRSAAPADLFAGTPAAEFAVGEQGIAVPEPTPLGDWTPAQVRSVLLATRRTLALGRIDPAVLAGDPAKYVASLSESARRPTAAEIAKGQDALGYVTRMAPGYTLAGAVRTKGALSVTLGVSQQLVVTADVVWVYPLTGPVGGDLARPGARLVVLHTVENYEWYPKKGYAPRDQGLRPGAGEQGVYNMDCELSRRGLLALPRSTADALPTAEEPEAFDPDTKPEDFPGTC